MTLRGTILPIDDDELASVTRGLRLETLTNPELEDLRNQHSKIDLFASGVIVTAVDELLKKRFALGTGTAFVETDRHGTVCFGTRPETGRKKDWLDPYLLYRAHFQVVRLTFQPEGRA